MGQSKRLIFFVILEAWLGGTPLHGPGYMVGTRNLCEFFYWAIVVILAFIASCLVFDDFRRASPLENVVNGIGMA